MTRFTRIPGVALCVTLLGCVHVGPVTSVAELADDHGRVYVSSTRYDDGTIHRAVVERVSADEGKCERSDIIRFKYDKAGMLTKRVHEQRECGVVLFEIVDERQPSTHQMITTIYRDVNRDGRFDEEQNLGPRTLGVPRAPPTSIVLAFGGDSLEDISPPSCETASVGKTTRGR
jgi:hypothetical protein